MTAWRVVVTAPADADIDAVLDHTEAAFGSVQRRRYEDRLIEALRRLTEGPAVPGSLPVEDFPNLHRLPLRRPSAHALFYRAEAERILVLRLLHEAMDPARHLAED